MGELRKLWGHLLYGAFNAMALAFFFGGVIALFFGEGAYSPGWFYACAVLFYLAGLEARHQHTGK